LPPREPAPIGDVPEDRVTRWRREADERTRQRQVAKGELIFKTYEGPQPADTRAGDDAWNQWCDQRIEAALAVERKLLAEEFGKEVGRLLDERDDKRDAELEAKLAKIWTSLTAAHRSICEISRDRVERTFREVVADSAKKMN
jgi:hypothetical protein